MNTKEAKLTPGVWYVNGARYPGVKTYEQASEKLGEIQRNTNGKQTPTAQEIKPKIVKNRNDCDILKLWKKR